MFDADMRRAVWSALQQTYQRIRAAQARQTAALVAAGADAEALAADTWRLAGEVAAATPDAALGACRAGCRWCCHQPIHVSAVEAVALADALRETFPADWLAQLRALLAQRVAAIAGYPDERAYLQARLPCGFLAPDGSCAVYEFRPTVCRGWRSLSAEACQALYADLAAPMPPIDQAARVGAGAALHGMCDGLTACGRDGRLFELHHAVLRALDTPDAGARLAAGERLFEGCLATAGALVPPEIPPAAGA